MASYHAAVAQARAEFISAVEETEEMVKAANTVYEAKLKEAWIEYCRLRDAASRS